MTQGTKPRPSVPGTFRTERIKQEFDSRGTTGSSPTSEPSLVSVEFVTVHCLLERPNSSHSRLSAGLPHGPVLPKPLDRPSSLSGVLSVTGVARSRGALDARVRAVPACRVCPAVGTRRRGPRPLPTGGPTSTVRYSRGPWGGPGPPTLSPPPRVPLGSGRHAGGPTGPSTGDDTTCTSDGGRTTPARPTGSLTPARTDPTRETRVDR